APGPRGARRDAPGSRGEAARAPGPPPGVIVTWVSVQLPLAILPMYAVLRRVDLSLMTVAGSLGGPPWQAIRLVLLPLTLPGIAAAAILTFLTTLGFYVTPLILGGDRDLFMANLIDIQVSKIVDWNLGSALPGDLTVAGLVVIAIGSRLIGWGWLIGDEERAT